MYRKPSGGMGFSFGRFINNAVPSMMIDPGGDPGHISMPQKDAFYMHQLHSANIYALDENSLFVSGIIDSESSSKKTFQKLQKTGALTDVGLVDTRQIGPQFTHQMAVVNVVSQKQIIDLLFWWEEECHRMRKLEGEKGELEGLVGEQKRHVAKFGSGGGNQEQLDQLSLLLERVKMKIAWRPSERRQDVERDEDDMLVRYRNGVRESEAAGDETLPGYRS